MAGGPELEGLDQEVEGPGSCGRSSGSRVAEELGSGDSWAGGPVSAPPDGRGESDIGLVEVPLACWGWKGILGIPGEVGRPDGK